MSLKQEIIKHIYNSYSFLISEDYLIDEKLRISENSLDNKYNIYIGRVTALNQDISILISKLSDEEKILVISVKDCPSYACILNTEDELSRICYSTGAWLDCNTYLQATFLAATEQLQDLLISCKPSEDRDILNVMYEFLDYYEEYE